MFLWGWVGLGLGSSSCFIIVFTCFPTQQNLVDRKHRNDILATITLSIQYIPTLLIPGTCLSIHFVVVRRTMPAGGRYSVGGKNYKGKKKTHEPMDTPTDRSTQPPRTTQQPTNPPRVYDNSTTGVQQKKRGTRTPETEGRVYRTMLQRGRYGGFFASPRLSTPPARRVRTQQY